MALRAGEFVHFLGTTRLLRLQSGGLSSFNRPSESIREVGSDQPIERVFDNPDATFETESFDMRPTYEYLFMRDSTPLADGTEIDFNQAVPVNFLVPWRRKRASTEVHGGAVFPYMYIEQASYRIAVQQNAGKTFTIRGDAGYFVPGGSPRQQEFVKAGTGPYAFDDTALKTVEDNVDLFALCVTAYDPSSGTPYRRLRVGDDYTADASGVTLTAATNADWADTTTTIVVCYGTATADTIDDVTVDDIDVRPSAYKAKDLELWISDGGATPVFSRWRGVQSFDVAWRVTYDTDYELGNRYAVNRDYETPEVSGNIAVRPESGDYLIGLIAQVSGADPDDIQNLVSSVPLELELRVFHPKDHTEQMMTLYVPDARIIPPATPVRVGQKADLTFPFDSDTGTLLVYNGARP